MNNGTLAINEQLSNSIVQMKKLHTLESKKKNQEQQAKNDKRYRELVIQVTQLCHAVHYAQTQFAFPYQPQMTLMALLDQLQRIASQGAVEEEAVDQIAAKAKSAQDQTKREWAKFFPDFVSSICNTLRIIQKIDPEQVSKCLDDIQAAERWQNNGSDLQQLKTLSAALKRSNDSIQRLNMNQEITAFLSKIASNTATLNDLSENILNWIQHEQLSDKIRLSFR